MTMMRRELPRSKGVDREHEARARIAIPRILLAKPRLSVCRLAAITINEFFLLLLLCFLYSC
jgi:hypothetical protein